MGVGVGVCVCEGGGEGVGGWGLGCVLYISTAKALASESLMRPLTPELLSLVHCLSERISALRIGNRNTTTTAVVYRLGFVGSLIVVIMKGTLGILALSNTLIGVFGN